MEEKKGAEREVLVEGKEDAGGRVEAEGTGARGG